MQIKLEIVVTSTSPFTQNFQIERVGIAFFFVDLRDRFSFSEMKQRCAETPPSILVEKGVILILGGGQPGAHAFHMTEIEEFARIREMRILHVRSKVRSPH